MVIDGSEIDFSLKREKEQLRNLNRDHKDRSCADGELQSSIMSHRHRSGFIDSQGEHKPGRTHCVGAMKYTYVHRGEGMLIEAKTSCYRVARK